MPAAAQTSPPATLGQSESADAFGSVLDVVCKEFAPGIAPLSTEQLRAAAQLADEAWHQYCEAGGDAATTVGWVRQRLATNRAVSVTGKPMDVRTVQMAFQALFDRHGLDFPES